MELNYKYGWIEITDIVYHRGICPCPMGHIYVGDEEFIKALKKACSKVKLPAFFKKEKDYIVDYIGIRNGVRFASGYTEFLYPRGPSLGHHLDIEWYEADMESYLLDIEGLYGELSEKDKEAISTALYIFIDILNEYLADAEKVIREFIRAEEEEILSGEGYSDE